MVAGCRSGRCWPRPRAPPSRCARRPGPRPGPAGHLRRARPSGWRPGSITSGQFAQCDPTTLRDLALVLRHAFADRYHWLGDPQVAPVPLEGLLAPGYARAVADSVRRGEDAPRWRDGAPWATYAAYAAHDPWPHDPAVGDAPLWRPGGGSTPGSGTTHVSAVDAAGNAVAVTHTAANHFGSGVLCPRTGLLLDSAMAWFNAAPGAANSIGPGARPLANMGPVLLSRDGRAVAALGASGGRRIVSAVAQLAIGLIDSRAGVEDVLAVPRLEGSGRDLVVDEALEGLGADLDDLDPVTVAASNEPFAMDFARPSLAGFDNSGQPVSAISTLHYND
ncbi:MULTISPECIES: gamma-glutamyltransferase [unclassified Pseudonocardia]|uniref:gamma-glutamyltransferase n=1 Tax=unclassified Pseudonocardia TaxID=2619320 RepID=UPI00094B3A61|nr:gamma-glutamyltransferase [Pseudonocardia sp. Ae707_Ps1]